METQRKLLEYARGLSELDLQGFVETLDTAEAILPMLAPTALKHGSKNLMVIRLLAEAAIAFQLAYPDTSFVLEGALEAETMRHTGPGSGFVPRAEPTRMRRHDDEDEPTGDAPPIPSALLRSRAGAKAFRQGEDGGPMQ